LIGATNRVIATVAVGLWPQQIAIDTRTNTAYVVDTHADSVSVIDGRTHAAVQR
jgi:DNA-binding beta-propeller fold protein YncE